ncbi:11735_t:CDS:2, partial [Entrophospora sp. SA101]
TSQQATDEVIKSSGGIQRLTTKATKDGVVAPNGSTFPELIEFEVVVDVAINGNGLLDLTFVKFGNRTSTLWNVILILWDGMFAEDPTLRIVDFVCIAMILHIRDELLESDFTGCLSMLMTYPPIDDVQLLVPQAIHLRDHLSPEGGAYIISENALRVGKPLPAPYQVYEHSRSESIVPDGFVHVTKNVLESRSAAVLNKAILTAVGEVKKNVLRRSDIQQNYDGRKQTHSELSKLREQNHNFSIVVNQNVEKIYKNSDDSTSHRLKYMRDVLNGTLKDSSQNFDVNYNHNGPEDHDHWEVVDDGVSVVSVAGTEDETAFVSKESKFVPSSSNSSTVNSNVGSKSMINNNHIQTKRLPSPPLPPLPPPLSNSIQQKQSFISSNPNSTITAATTTTANDNNTNDESNI